MIRRVVADHYERLAYVARKPLQKNAEAIGIHPALHRLESHVAASGHRRYQFEPDAVAAVLPRRRPVDQRLGVPAVAVGADDSLVQEVDLRSHSPSPFLQIGKGLVQILLDLHGVLLVALVYRALGTQAQLCQQPARRGLARDHPEGLAHRAQRPEVEAHLVLVRVVEGDRVVYPRHHLGGDFRRSPAVLAFEQGMPAARAISLEPAEQIAGWDLQQLGDLVGLYSVLHRLATLLVSIASSILGWHTGYMDNRLDLCNN